MAILNAEALAAGYGGRRVVGPVELRVEAGELLLIEGPNGSGKSTLLRTLAGLQPPVSGRYRWDVPMEARRLVPQSSTLENLLPATVRDVLATGLQRGPWRGLRAPRAGREVEEAAERVGMAERLDALFRELSEGQKQLVLLARALIGSPRALLLDEPTAAMDVEREARTLRTLRRQCDERDASVLLIAHGTPDAEAAADRVLRLDRDGRVAELVDGMRVGAWNRGDPRKEAPPESAGQPAGGELPDG